jgi:hypothetical protein
MGDFKIIKIAFSDFQEFWFLQDKKVNEIKSLDWGCSLNVCKEANFSKKVVSLPIKTKNRYSH